MTKAEVINEIADKTGVDRGDVQTSIEAFFEVIKDSMAAGESIYVRGFGSFVNKKRARKVARNISQNTAIVIDEHYVPSFKPSKMFVEKVKTNHQPTGGHTPARSIKTQPLMNGQAAVKV